MILMEKYRNFSFFVILIPTPDFPHFHYMLGGNLGSLLDGVVSVMKLQEVQLRMVLVVNYFKLLKLVLLLLL